jgi:sirohydrochlorin cobaltochelatase
MHGLILFAHGARDAQWAEPFEAVAARVRALRPQQPVRLAYLELMAPSLGEVAADLCVAGCRTVSVLPLFLGQGGHLKRLVQQLHEAHPAVRFLLHHAAGEHAALIAAMAAVAVETVDAAAAEPLP